MSTPLVRFFSNTRIDGTTVPGAPVINGTAGSLIAALQAFLIDGFGQVTLDAVSLVDNVATATKAAHPFREYDHLRVSWTGFSAIVEIYDVLTNSFKFSIAEGTPAPSGSLTAKFAEVGGWAKPFHVGNIAVFRSQSAGSPQRYFRFDDSGTQIARLFMYRTLTDENTGTFRVPLSTQFQSPSTGGVALWKSNTADSVSRKWFMCADSQFVYLGINADNNDQTGFGFYYFGDPIPYKTNDQFHSVITGSHQDTPASKSHQTNTLINHSANQRGRYLCASYDEMTESPNLQLDSCARSQNYLSGSGGFPFPDPAYLGLELDEVQIFEDSAAASSSGLRIAKRGVLPGLYGSTQALTYATVPSLSRRTDIAGLPGIQVVGMVLCSGDGTGHPGFFAVKGPSGWSWRS